MLSGKELPGQIVDYEKEWKQEWGLHRPKLNGKICLPRGRRISFVFFEDKWRDGTNATIEIDGKKHKQRMIEHYRQIRVQMEEDIKARNSSMMA